MIKLFSTLILTCTLLGCVTVPNQINSSPHKNDAVVDLKKMNFFGSGLENSTNFTYTQFNENYAITAKHTDKKHKVVWTCEDCDLVFYEKKLEGFKHDDYWENGKPLENVKLLGHVGIFIKELEGRDLAIVGMINNVIVGNLMTITPIKGMSGGPVLNDSNKIIGMNIGYK